MLRQWENLEASSSEGLKVCSSYTSPGVANRIVEWKAKFMSYREQARRARSIPSFVDEPKGKAMLRSFITGQAHPDTVVRRHETFLNSTLSHWAALTGDVRLMEALVAHGAAVDFPFLKQTQDFKPAIVAPTDATALVVVCVRLATADLDGPAGVRARAILSREKLNELDRSTECAMQLVRLGADPTRTFNLRNAPDTPISKVYRSAGLDGKSAFELAQMSKRKELVELMEQHLRYTAEERAHAVHCRCGSRLPWMACHSTGIGVSRHYLVDPAFGVMYRVSPLAKCPCKNTAKAHYECCWRDTARPAYLLDTAGHSVRMSRIPVDSDEGRAIGAIREHGGFATAGRDIVATTVALLRSSPGMFPSLFGQDGPKSQLSTWDPLVYAGCLERLGNDCFFWKDLHWGLDTSELLIRTKAWNKALHEYCDDAGLVGEERDRVVAKHTANPRAPCGRPGCAAFEKEVREFQRCSRCKSIAYCGRACQKMDWAEHRKACCEPN
jgi:MYND finger